jgi:hypothetical protein
MERCQTLPRLPIVPYRHEGGSLKVRKSLMLYIFDSSPERRRFKSRAPQAVLFSLLSTTTPRLSKMIDPDEATEHIY